MDGSLLSLFFRSLAPAGFKAPFRTRALSFKIRLDGAVFAGMPEAKDEDRAACDFIAHLVTSNEDAPDFAWRVGFQSFSDPWKL